jgi:hypothetical protein
MFPYKNITLLVALPAKTNSLASAESLSTSQKNTRQAGWMAGELNANSSAGKLLRAWAFAIPKKRYVDGNIRLPSC